MVVASSLVRMQEEATAAMAGCMHCSRSACSKWYLIGNLTSTAACISKLAFRIAKKPLVVPFPGTNTLMTDCMGHAGAPIWNVPLTFTRV